MQSKPSLLPFILCLYVSTVHAEEIKTEFFYVSAPSGWEVQNDDTAFIIAKGNEARVDNEIYPDFSGYYCVPDKSSNKGKHVTCPGPCSEKTLETLLGGQRAPKAFNLAAVKKIPSTNGDIEYTTSFEMSRQRGNRSERVTSALSLFCRKNGQFYFSLSTTSDLDRTNRLFNEVKKSIKWR